MLDQNFLRQLSERAAALLPAADAKRKELEQDMFRLLQSSLGRLNLVTRDELSAQLKVLEKATLRISELERRIAELESARAAQDTNDAGQDSPQLP